MRAVLKTGNKVAPTCVPGESGTGKGGGETADPPTVFRRNAVYSANIVSGRSSRQQSGLVRPLEIVA
jgi:hypothetical protein